MRHILPAFLTLCLLFIFIECNPPTESKTQYTLTVTVSPASGGSVSRSPSGSEYDKGKSVTLTATPAAGYQFTRWEGSVSGTSNPITITMTSDKNVTAVFTPVLNQYTLTVTASPANGGTVTKSPNQNQYGSGTVVTLTANPATGYQFTRWEGSVSGTSNPVTVTMNGNKNVTAVFTAAASQYTLAVSASPGSGGTVTKSPNQSQYASGTVVTLTANPAAGYQFSVWQGSVTGTSNPTLITMDGNKSVTAVFSSSPTPLIQLSTSGLSFTATAGGSDPPGQTVTITNGGSGTLDGLTRFFPDGTPTWLSVTLNGSTAPTTLTVRPSMAIPFGTLGPGSYQTRIGIASASASNTPQYITVIFTVLPQTSLTAYASYDNTLAFSSLNPAVGNTVYASAELGSGIDYAWIIYGGYNYFYVASALKFDVQSQISGRSIASATLRLYVYALRGDFTITPRIRVSAFVSNWNPNTITYNSWSGMSVYTGGQAVVNAPSNSVMPIDFDVTTIVRNWASGTWSNYGFNMAPENHTYPGYSSLQTTFFQSLEMYWAYNQRPQLIIQFQ